MAETVSHQALLYTATAPQVRSTLLPRLRESGVVTEFDNAAWGIDSSRALATEAYRTDAAGRIRHFVLIATTMTVEAQNALLKILEEPPRGVVFHCVFPPGMSLLPTVRSRLVPVVLPTEVVDTAMYDALVRLPLVEQLAEVEERLKQKDVVWVEGIKRGALARLAQQVPTVPAEASARLYGSLLRLGTRGAANKMLLEDVLLTVATAAKNR